MSRTSDPFGLNLPDPLPPELGQLTATLEWWLLAHDVFTPTDAPKAEAGQTIHLEANNDPELDACAAALCGLLTNADAAAVTDVPRTESGKLDLPAWMTRCADIRDQMWQLRSIRNEPNELLSAVPAGIREIVDRLVGDLDPDRDSPGDCVVVDGPATAACVLLAYEIDPSSLARIRPLQLGQSPIESRTWQHLRVGPVLPLETGFRNGELLPVAVSLINRALELCRGALDEPEPG